MQKSPSHDTRKTLDFNNALLLRISAHSVIVLTKLRALHLAQEFLIVSNDDELEVRLMTSVLDDLVQRLSESSNVILIKVGSGLIKSNDLGTVSMKLFRKRGNYLHHN